MMALEGVMSGEPVVNEGNGSLHCATEQQNQAFELELRLYNGDDPLDVWDRYIKWIERSYTKRDKRIKLSAVLERAVHQFVDENKFYDDPRYVEMWIKLAQRSTQPLNMFSYMQTEGIGVQQAALYTAWSKALETHGDKEQAEIIFMEGLKCGARPLDELQQQYRAFQHRVSGRVAGPTHSAAPTQEKQDEEPELPSSVGCRTRRNRRVLVSVNREEESSVGAGEAVAGKENSQCPSVTAVQPKAVFDENAASGLPHETARAPAPSHRSLKLPAPILRTRVSPSYPPSDKDPSGRSHVQKEELIVNSHRNHSLSSSSPDNTYHFAQATTLASTPFGGVRGQTPASAGPSVAHRGAAEGARGTMAHDSGPDATQQTWTEANKLSRILEVSQEWRSASSVSQQQLSAAAVPSTSRVMEHIPVEGEEGMEQGTPAPPGEHRQQDSPTENQSADPCSVDVKRRLLQKVDFRTIPNLHREARPLPSNILGLQLGAQELYYLIKMPNLPNHYHLPPEESCMVLKVDRCPVPWDAYICSQLKARLPADTEQYFLDETSCFLFEDGCVTLWKMPHDTTLAALTAGEPNEHAVGHLALRLVEMVRRMHTCHLVHGALRPHTLIYYPSRTTSDPGRGVVMPIDFSSSLDLKLHPEVKSVASLSIAADLLSQGLLSPTSSPYQLDLLGIAETVHLMLFGRPLDVVKTEAGWRLADSAEMRDAVWPRFFQEILNCDERSTVAVLTTLQEDLKDYTENEAECGLLTHIWFSN
ncbi:hypothetical protein ACEWY4_022259 [Coilia grayii]|uniref:BUB1 N-terminal domain-containing protein n=1 Tax=Coilia grayii TaxID=363190 RepID=A0ABD1J6Z8_9TELE